MVSTHTVIFDIGGTLIGGEDLFLALSTKINKLYNLEVKQDLIDKFQAIYNGEQFFDVKTILNKVIREILNKNNLEDKSFDAGEFYCKHFLEGEMFLYKGCIELLEYLKNLDIKLIVLSDSDSDVMIPELKKAGIYHYFDEINISSDLKCYKTSKKMVDIFKDKLSKPLDNILFVGDSSADLFTAKNLGVKSILINNDSKKLEPDYRIKNLLELKNLL